MKHKYPWRRFWYEESRAIPIDEQNGYLLDVEGLTGLEDPQARSFLAISKARCLILLGGPGLGKSTTLRDAFETARSLQTTPTLWFDLKGRREEDLRRYLFEQPEWRGWREGASALEVFLDSLDECYMRLETLPTLLAQELEIGPREKLRIRLVCRTAVWPQSFEEHLERLWPASVEKYRLAPLRRQDVLAAAKMEVEVKDPAGFLNRVEHSGAGPLAAVPQTLELLFRLEKDGNFPKTRAELFDQGCQKLCEEPDQSQWDKRRAGHAAGQAGLDHSQRRLHLASQIAALTLFCGYRGLWLGRPSECPEDYLCPGVNLPLDELPSTIEDLQDMSRAPMFRMDPADHVDWAHRSYAEYLAARFASAFRPMRIARLLIHPDSPHIVPQLAGVAAWMASQNPEIFQMLLECDPQVLLSADLALTEPVDRHRLVNALLEGIQAGTFLPDSQLRGSYGKLNHDKLVEQLQPWIAECSLKGTTRCEAIFMMAKCQAEGLQALLADIALAQNENRHVRELAAWALTRTNADAATRARLLPLARGAAGEDPQDELKGAALEALWKEPRQIEVREMFELLTRPKDRLFFGNYERFISVTLVKNLASEHLPQALDWIQAHNPHSGHGEPFKELVDSILRCSLEFLTDSILGSFARAVCQGLERYNRQIFGENQKKNQPLIPIGTAKRRKLLAALIHLVPPPRESVYRELSSHQPSLIEQEDESWLLEQIESEKDPEIRKQWAKLICGSSSFTEQLHEAAWRIPELLEEYAVWLKPVDIDSPLAKQLRQSQKQFVELEASNRELIRSQDANRVVFDAQLVERLLQQSEAGEVDAFWRLNVALVAAPKSQQHASEIISDLTSLPGWKAITHEVHSRICDAAQRFIQIYAPRECEDWFQGEHKGYRPEMAGYRAFLLLQKTDTSRLTRLSLGTWSKWAHVIVGYPLASNTWGTAEPHQQLVAAAYRADPEAVVASVERLVNGTEALHDGELFDLWKLGKCRDARMGQAMLDLARRVPPRPPATLGYLLLEALHCEGEHHSDVSDFVASVLRRASESPEARGRALIAGAVLITELPSAAYPVIWPAITHDAEFGKELMQKVAVRQSLPGLLPAAWVSTLTEKQIADLWQWLCKHFPPDEDPKVDGFLGPRHQVGFLRNGLLQALMLRGTKTAVNELEKLAGEHPATHLGLRQALLQAQENYQQKSWKPLSPQQLLQLSKGPSMHCHAALVTAIDNETKALMDVLRREAGEPELQSVNGRDFWSFLLKVSNKEIKICVAQATDKRSDAAQALLQDIVRDLHPELVLSVGACGAFADRAKEGSVICARNIFHYEPEQIVQTGPRKRPEPYKCSALIINRLKMLKANRMFDSILGDAEFHTDKDFASGDKTIKDTGADLRQYLHEFSVDIYGFEQEGPGLLHAIWELGRNPKWASVQVGLLKGVSDSGDAAMNADKDKRQYEATQRAAQIAVAMLRHYPFERG